MIIIIFLVFLGPIIPLSPLSSSTNGQLGEETLVSLSGESNLIGALPLGGDISWWWL